MAVFRVTAAKPIKVLGAANTMPGDNWRNSYFSCSYKATDGGEANRALFRIFSTAGQGEMDVFRIALRYRWRRSHKETGLPEAYCDEEICV